VRNGIQRAVRTVDDVSGAWVKEQKVVVDNGVIKEFCVDMKLTFVMKE